MATQQEANPHEPIGLSEAQLKEYFEFLGFTEDEVAAVRVPSLKTLETLVVRQLAAAPFTNIDIHYSPKHQIVIELEYLFDKIVRRKRGGYCMELNTLFSHLLATIGFNNWLAGARVALEKSGDVADRNFSGMSHCVNLVEFKDGKTYMADVGFGGENPVRPLELVDGFTISGVDKEQHRLIRAPLAETRRKKLHWILQRKADEDSAWVDNYMFLEDEFTMRDFLIMSNWTSTKEWIFMENILAAKVVRDGDNPIGRYTMFNDGIKKRLNSEHEVSIKINNEAERIAALNEYWGVVLSEEDQTAIRGRVTEMR